MLGRKCSAAGKLVCSLITGAQLPVLYPKSWTSHPLAAQEEARLVAEETALRARKRADEAEKLRAELLAAQQAAKVAADQACPALYPCSFVVCALKLA